MLIFFVLIVNVAAMLKQH